MLDLLQILADNWANGRGKIEALIQESQKMIQKVISQITAKKKLLQKNQVLLQRKK